MSKKQDYVLSNIYSKVMAEGNAYNPAATSLAVTRQMYIGHLMEMCANRFEWKNLPDTIDPRYLELILLQQAVGVFFKDEGGSEKTGKKLTNTQEYFFLPGTGAGMPNLQDIPTYFQVTALDQTINARLRAVGDDVECVPIFANYLRTPEWDKILLFAHKLAEITETIEINTMQMRYPTIVSVPENKRLTYVNLIRNHRSGEPVIFGDESMDSNSLETSISVFNTGINPDTLAKLWDSKNQLWNECMTMLGINNANQDKRERLVAAEVSANDDQVQATRNIALNSRQLAAEQINARWGLNISVDFHKEELPDMEDPDDDGTDDEGEE